MFGFINDIIQKQKRVRRFKDHKRGYAWAAVKLLKGSNATDVINYVDSAKTFDSYGQFDRGIEDAVRDFGVILDKNILNIKSMAKISEDDMMKRY